MNDSLTSMAREYLSLPRNERAVKCCRDVWITHPYAVGATECVKALVGWPRVASNPCMAVVGSPGVGKSRLAQRWRDESFAGKAGWAGKVLYIDMSNRKSGLDLEKRLLQELGKLVRGRAYTLSARDYTEAQEAVRTENIRAVVFDEIHGLQKRMSEQRLHNTLEALKGFTGPEWGLNVILCGIQELKDLLEEDEQIESRFGLRSLTLPDWKNDNIFASFVASFMCHMPLREVSEVTSEEFLSELYGLARLTNPPDKKNRRKAYEGGQPGSSLRAIIDIMKEACRYAVVTGEESIDVGSIKSARARLKGDVDVQELLLLHQRAL
ncbi:hypothetical protein PS847_00849 [Pseudomonas fluorescens]|uniref:AAA+ ATPase domain-containing protein n=2 Tax=Pseudomonas fluorescens TaxID=294 RepID=A0A5E7HDR7_PSEFL|nr:hypothetical protein PS847_00849 [Pseudomonas fluorescens]